MKIALVTNLYGKLARGGAERIVRAEADGLLARGHDVVVITGVPKTSIPVGICSPEFPADCPPPPGTEDQPHATRIAVRSASARVLKYYPPNVYFYSDDVKHGFTSRLVWHAIDTYNSKSAEKLGRILDQERPDVVHTHNLMGLGFLVPAAIRRRKIAHVHTVHDVQLIHPSGLLPASGNVSAAARLSSLFTKRVFGSPGRVLFPSRYLLGLHERLGFFPRSRKEVLTNPVPDVGPERSVPGAPAFLFAGQLAKHKGILRLLEAWKAMDDARATLVIAGAGPLEAEVRRIAQGLKNVEVIGKIDAVALTDAYRAASHVVVPSLVLENSPAVIAEAMSQGTPVIASATGGIPEAVNDGKDGMLVPAGDVAALSAAMRTAAKLDGWKMMSDAARTAAGSKGLDRHLSDLERFYAI
jgi:glycosyltransferase involved in cell wall biosynthesis